MIDLFNKLYPQKPIGESGLLNRLKVYSLLRYILRNLANFFIPIYLKVEKNLGRQHSIGNVFQKGLIVSFTSFPARIDTVWLVVESILRQTVKPEMLILWLSEDQFPTEDSLPKELLLQKKRGLEIRLCSGDIRSHKKYYYSMLNYPNYDLVTIDDDFFYPSTLIENLLANRDGRRVVAHRCLKINIRNEHLAPYETWGQHLGYSKASLRNFATSGGGTLFPAGTLHPDVLDRELFLKLCPAADDVWLFFMALINGTETIKTDLSPLYLPILNENKFALSHSNVGESQNDVQIQNVCQYYKNFKGVDIEAMLMGRVKG